MITERSTFVADIEILHTTEEYETYSMSMNEVHPDVIECNLARPAFLDPEEIPCNFARPKFINEDQGMNDEEKEEAFFHYMKFGYHHPSITKEVEDIAALTELKLINDKPLSDKDFETQFDLKHLPLKNDLCQVPILGSKPLSLHVAANNVTIIPPFKN